MKSLDDKYVYMTETPVRKLVWKLAVPTMVSMMVTALYNVVDAAFVGHLSTEATAGIGIAFAYMTPFAHSESSPRDYRRAALQRPF